jgi:hypothetical protein
MTRLPTRHSLMSDYVMAHGYRQEDLLIGSSYLDEQKLPCTMRAYAFQSVIHTVASDPRSAMISLSPLLKKLSLLTCLPC